MRDLAKYAINQEGSEALKKLGSSILISCNEIMEQSRDLEQKLAELEEGLGIYAEEIRELTTKNRNILLAHKENLEGLAEKLRRQGDEILELMGLGVIAGTGTCAAESKPAAADSEKRNYQSFLVQNGYAEKADFGKLDPASARDMAMAIAETREQFPDLDLKFTGSLQARNEALKRDLTKSYLNEYKKAYPNASEKDLLPVIRQQVEEDMQGFEPGNGTIAQSLFVKNPSGFAARLCAQYNGITINEQYGGDYGLFCQVKSEDVKAGWKPQNCDTPKATVDHELGHQIAKLVDAHLDPDIIELYKKFITLDDKKRSEILSGYAAESIHEFLAESWSEYRNNPKCRPCAKFVAEKMIDLYNDTRYEKRKVLRR